MEHEQPEEQRDQGPAEGASGGSVGSKSTEEASVGAETALTDAGAALSDAVASLLRIAADRGRRRLGRAAAQGRVRMEIRQLRRDRTRMVEKLGREVIRLVEGGELDHPGLLRGVERIREQDARIEEAEAADPAAAAASDESGAEKNIDPAEGME